MNINLWDLHEILVVYILLSTFESVHMVLTVNKPNVRRFIAWIESADWNPCFRYVSFKWDGEFCNNDLFTGMIYYNNVRFTSGSDDRILGE